MSTHITVEERFLAKTEWAENGCLLWTAVLINEGYGRFWYEGKHTLAHRAAYEIFVGPIPDGMTVDHECHNKDPICPGGIYCLHRRCVNYDHLVLKPQARQPAGGQDDPGSQCCQDALHPWS